MKIKLDVDMIKFISMFGNITKTTAKDCFKQDKRLIFIVNEDQVRRAVGKQGANIKRMERLFNKKIKVVEFNPDLIKFVVNVIHPLKAEEINEEDGIVVITPVDSNTRGMLIGRGAINLRGFEEVIQRYFDIKELKVK